MWSCGVEDRDVRGEGSSKESTEMSVTEGVT